MTKHLTIEERIKMEALLRAGISADKIAKQLDRHRLKKNIAMGGHVSI